MKLSSLILYIFSTAFIAYLLAIHTLASISLINNHKPTEVIFYGSLALTLVYCMISAGVISKNKLMSIVGVVPFILLVVTFLYGFSISSQVHDVSFDGQAYQGEAVVSLIEGWNPILSPVTKDLNPYVTSLKYDTWLDAYPKAMWYNEAVAYDITHNFKSTKFFSFSIMVGAFAAAFLTLREFTFAKNKDYNTLIGLILSVLVIINPVSIVQTTSIALDGVLYYLLVILCAILLRIYFNAEKTLNFDYFALITTLIVLCNAKTSGMVYSVIILGSLIVYAGVTQSKYFVNLLVSTCVGLFLGVAIFGFNPYLTNTYYHGNLLYPVLGSSTISFDENTPSNYRSKTSTEIFFSGLFFQSNDIFRDGPQEPAILKLPFTINKGELESLKNPQLKKGGLGPLFGGIAVLATICFITSMVYNYRKVLSHNHYLDGKQDSKVLGKLFVPIYVVAVFVLSFVITKNSSTLRYIPHIWILISFMIGYCIYTRNTIIRTFAFVVLLICMFNTALVSTIYFSNQIATSQEADARMTNMLGSGDTYNIYFASSSSTRQILRDNNIPVINSQTVIDSCWYYAGQYSLMPFNETQVCILTK
jgi:hypothetical protein